MIEDLFDWAKTVFLTDQVFVSAHVLIIAVHVILIGVAYFVMLERKLSAWIQDRLGPNRVGFDFGLPWLAFLKGCLGLGQPLADGIKFLLKEDYAPTQVDKALFSLAPIVIIIPALIGFAIIPWGGHWDMPVMNLPFIGEMGGSQVLIAGADVNIGIIYLIAVASLGVYGVTLGGWASNSKFSFIGGLRCTAQMISYELPMGLALLSILLLVGSVSPMGIIEYQAWGSGEGWLILSQPIACFIFFLAILAEANRAPFDNAEAEQELVGGYHTEYSSMRFALFFLAEYAHMVTSSAFFALLFFGGFDFFGLFGTGLEATGFLAVLAKVSVFGVKIFLIVSLMMLIRWSLPRLRYDQVMMMGWQVMIPLALTIVVVTSFMVWFGQTGWLPMLIVNTVMAVVVTLMLPLFGQRTTVNRKVPMYGSRFCPVPGEEVQAAPTLDLAREDRPHEGTLPAN
jgi:NADH-quinone oxidoreductase subunit H